MAHVHIANNYFTAKVDLKGAQLASFYNITESEEYIWQRNPDFWSGSAPICFPIVGNLKDNTYTYEGNSYQMPKHGIVRYTPFEIGAKSPDACELHIRTNEELFKSYPFQFLLSITFSVTESGLRVDYAVLNEDTKPIPISVGYHPAFNIDIQNYKYSDYEIVFSEGEDLDLYWLQNGLMELRESNYLQNRHTIQLSKSTFDDDALIFKNIRSKKIRLSRKGSDWKIDVLTGGAPHLGIWAKPAAPFVCIEPWYTHTDEPGLSGEIFDKPGMMALEPGATFNSYYEIQV